MALPSHRPFDVIVSNFLFPPGDTPSPPQCYSPMSRHLLLPAMLITALLVTACKGIPSTANVSNDTEAIIRACRFQVDAWRLQSYEAETKAWAHVPYALKMLTNGTRTVGWEAISKSYQESFGNAGTTRGEPTFTTALSDFHVRVNGNAAWVVFHQHQIFDNQTGGQDRYETLEVRSLEKIDDRWQIVFQLTGPYTQD